MIGDESIEDFIVIVFDEEFFNEEVNCEILDEEVEVFELELFENSELSVELFVKLFIESKN